MYSKKAIPSPFIEEIKEILDSQLRSYKKEICLFVSNVLYYRLVNVVYICSYLNEIKHLEIEQECSKNKMKLRKYLKKFQIEWKEVKHKHWVFEKNSNEMINENVTDEN